VKQAGIDRLYFSPDSSLLVASSRDEVHAWKTSDGSQAFQSTAARILRSSFSDDGSLFFIQGRNQQGETSLSIWRAQDWSLASAIQTSGTYVVQPDGRQVFIFSNYPTTGQVTIFSLPDGKQAGQFRADGSIYWLGLSPDSKTAALSIPDPVAGALALYDTRGKLIKKVFCEHSCDASLPVFSADGKQVFMTGHLPTTGLEVGITAAYDTATGGLGRILRSPLNVSSEFDQMAVSPDGTQIAAYAGGEENMLYVWGKNSKPVSSLDWGAQTLWLGNLSPGDAQAAVYNDRETVKVLSLADGSVVRQFEHATQPLFSNEDLLLTTDLRDNHFAALHLWKVSSGESVVIFLPDITPPLIFSASDDLAAEAKDATVRLMKLPSGKMVSSFTAAGRPDVHLNGIAFAPDGTLVAAGDTNGGVWLWKVADRQPVFSFEGSRNPVMGLAFSPDGKFLAAAASDGSVAVYQVSDGQAAVSLNLTAVLKPILGEDTTFNNLAGLAYSPDGWLLAVTGTLNPLQAFPNRAPVVLLFQVSDGKLLQILHGGGGRVTFTADGKKLVASGDGAVQVWGVYP
jgi:WD40 repeat protein